MDAYSYIKYGQFMYKGKIYNWIFTADTETMLVKNGGDVVCTYKIPHPRYYEETKPEYIKQKLETHLNRHSNLHYEPFWPL